MESFTCVLSLPLYINKGTVGESYFTCNSAPEGEFLQEPLSFTQIFSEVKYKVAKKKLMLTTPISRFDESFAPVAWRTNFLGVDSS